MAENTVFKDAESVHLPVQMSVPARSINRSSNSNGLRRAGRLYIERPAWLYFVD
jgi:hypothetical protein